MISIGTFALGVLLTVRNLDYLCSEFWVGIMLGACLGSAAAIYMLVGAF